ncbi:hypothetical protein PF003_g32704 [Phytophthora fragariae]|nr:hypothetical protein PF003_g32704 [Phytophthora fragariae]
MQHDAVITTAQNPSEPIGAALPDVGAERRQHYEPQARSYTPSPCAEDAFRS